MTENQTTAELGKMCAGALIWRGICPPDECERCGAGSDDLCGDFEAQETQWDRREATSNVR